MIDESLNKDYTHIQGPKPPRRTSISSQASTEYEVAVNRNPDYAPTLPQGRHIAEVPVKVKETRIHRSPSTDISGNVRSETQGTSVVYDVPSSRIYDEITSGQQVRLHNMQADLEI